MDVQLVKIELMKKLLATEDISKLKSIKKIFQKEEKDWWNELSNEEQIILNDSMNEYEKGEFTSFESFIKPHLK